MFMTYNVDEVARSAPLADRLKEMHVELFLISKRAKQETPNTSTRQ